jgi:alpha-tubulin suppressor-like RCC1 family protein
MTVEGLEGVTALAAGRQHTCARRTDGTVSCWGANESGQLGRPATEDGLPPAPVPALTGVARIFAGGSNTCALLGAGELRCWGANDSGQLGDGSRESRAAPVPVPGVEDIIDLDMGNGARAGSKKPDISRSASFMCACTRAGTVLCWGNNSTGQLGDGTREDRSTPGPVLGITDAIDVAVGNAHACALHRSGAVSCWGRNEFGVVGDDTMGPATVRTERVAALRITDATELALGDAHSCARRRNGEVMCWGVNNFGQLGDDSTTLRPAPHPVSDFP